MDNEAPRQHAKELDELVRQVAPDFQEVVRALGLQELLHFRVQDAPFRGLAPEERNLFAVGDESRVRPPEGALELRLAGHHPPHPRAGGPEQARDEPVNGKEAERAGVAEVARGLLQAHDELQERLKAVAVQVRRLLAERVDVGRYPLVQPRPAAELPLPKQPTA